MKKQQIKFVGEDLKRLSLNAPKDKRYAVDLGVIKMFALQWLSTRSGELHYYVTAQAVAHNIVKDEALNFIKKIEELNPGVTCCLLCMEQIQALNEMAKNAKDEFRIKNCWTSSHCDFYGRPDGDYLLKNGMRVKSYGYNKTDLYIAFGCKKGEEKPLLLPN